MQNNAYINKNGFLPAYTIVVIYTYCK